MPATVTQSADRTRQDTPDDYFSSLVRAFELAMGYPPLLARTAAEGYMLGRGTRT